MRRAFIVMPLLLAALAGCGGSTSHSSSQLTIVAGDRQVVINSGLADDRVDWIVLRDYPADATDPAGDDSRVRFEGDGAVVTMPDGSNQSLRDSRVLFYLSEDGVEVYGIHLLREDLDVLHTEAFDSVQELIERLVAISDRRETS